MHPHPPSPALKWAKKVFPLLCASCVGVLLIFYFADSSWKSSPEQAARHNNSRTLTDLLDSPTLHRAEEESQSGGCENLTSLSADVAVHLSAAGGARRFIRELLFRHATLQRCMLRQKTPVRALVHECTAHTYCGGLGDRLRGTVLALLVAAATKRAFFIDHEKPKNTSLSTYLEPPARLLEPVGSTGSAHAMYLSPVDWRLSSLPRQQAERLREGEHVFKLRHVDRIYGGCTALARILKGLSSTEVVRWSSNLAPARWCVVQFLKEFVREDSRRSVEKLFKGVDDGELTKIGLRYLYQPTKIVEEAVARWKSTVLGRSLLKPCTLCLHMRTAHNVGHSKMVDSKERMYNFENFGKCGKMVEKKFVRNGNILCRAKNVTWLVITDHNDEVAILSALSAYSKQSLLVTTSSVGPPIHVDRFAPQQASRAARLDASLLRVFVDFRLLTECRFLVHSPSMFNLMATHWSESVTASFVRFKVADNINCTHTKPNETIYPTMAPTTPSWTPSSGQTSTRTLQLHDPSTVT